MSGSNEVRFNEKGGSQESRKWAEPLSVKSRLVGLDRSPVEREGEMLDVTLSQKFGLTNL